MVFLLPIFENIGITSSSGGGANIINLGTKGDGIVSSTTPNVYGYNIGIVIITQGGLSMYDIQKEFETFSKLSRKELLL